MNQAVLVSGCGRGLGLSIVAKHLELGDRVYALDYNLTDELRAIKEKNSQLHIFQCDISSGESVNAAVSGLLEAEKQIHFLYNVAGLYRFEDRVGLLETDLDAGLHMLNVNAVGALRVCKAVWPLLQSGSVIVNISSEAGSVGACRRTGEYLYCMSKSAMNMAAKIMSNELHPRHVRVINFHPGWLRTPMGGKDAMNSSRSVEPDASANDIVGIALRIDEIPHDQLYMQHTGELLPW